MLLALVVLLSAGAYIAGGIYRAEPVIVAATEDAGRIWLSLDQWHWPEETIDCVEYVVGNGDTLWGIVERYYPDAHTGEMVWAIRSANDLCGADGPMLRPGQVLWIPDPAMYGVGRE